MILRILACDNCRQGISRGATPATSSAECRRSNRCGSIKRTLVMRYRYKMPSYTSTTWSEPKPINADLCGVCRSPEIIGQWRERRIKALVNSGYEIEVLA